MDHLPCITATANLGTTMFRHALHALGSLNNPTSTEIAAIAAPLAEIVHGRPMVAKEVAQRAAEMVRAESLSNTGGPLGVYPQKHTPGYVRCAIPAQYQRPTHISLTEVGTAEVGEIDML